jgi:hypothetical protein
LRTPAARWRAGTARRTLGHDVRGIRDRDSSTAGKLGQEQLALTSAESSDAPIRSDSGALHDGGGAGLADAGQRTEHLIDLRLPGEVIIAVEHAGEGDAAFLDAGQHRRSGGARLSCLRECFLALLGDKVGTAMRAFLSAGPHGTTASRQVGVPLACPIRRCNGRLGRSNWYRVRASARAEYFCV